MDFGPLGPIFLIDVDLMVVGAQGNLCSGNKEVCVSNHISTDGQPYEHNIYHGQSTAWLTREVLQRAAQWGVTQKSWVGTWEERNKKKNTVCMSLEAAHRHTASLNRKRTRPATFVFCNVVAKAACFSQQMSQWSSVCPRTAVWLTSVCIFFFHRMTKLFILQTWVKLEQPGLSVSYIRFAQKPKHWWKTSI